MKTDRKCQPEPSPMTSQQAATLLFQGWAAARAGEPEDETMPAAWLEGWRLFNTPAVQTKLLRLKQLH